MKQLNTVLDTNFDTDFASTGVPILNSSVERFDIFKGVQTEAGKVEKIRSVGSASLRDGFNTYIVELKTLLDVRFYMLPCKDPSEGADFVILTRELARNSNRKYFWNVVGEGLGMTGPNRGLLKLSWDLFGENVYLNTVPKKSSSVSSYQEVQAA
jgi:hypothetical protein